MFSTRLAQSLKAAADEIFDSAEIPDDKVSVLQSNDQLDVEADGQVTTQ